MPDPDQLKNGTTLCVEAGIDPDEQITRFTMQDLAAVLIQSDWPHDNIIKVLKNADAYSLANCLCDASGWPEIFETYADMVLDDLK